MFTVECATCGEPICRDDSISVAVVKAVSVYGATCDPTTGDYTCRECQR